MLGSPRIWSPFQRSHIVVAPCPTRYPQDGYSVLRSNRYATSAWPVSVNALNKYGVPKNPVPSRQWLVSRRSTNRFAATLRSESGNKLLCRMRTPEVVERLQQNRRAERRLR